MMVRSKKPVKALESIVRPYTFIPTKDISGGVNGRPFYFPKGKLAELDYSQYCAIVYSDYKGELWSCPIGVISPPFPVTALPI